MTETLQRAPRLDELDSLRGLLSIWVVISHVICWSGLREFSTSSPGQQLISSIIGAGPAVDAFMILSGFAISILVHKRNESYARFMQGRFFRIYPVYIICLALGATVAMSITPFVLNTAPWRATSEYFSQLNLLSRSEISNVNAHVLWHLTLLNGLIPAHMLTNSTGTLLAPAWSISLEWQYYIVAPLIVRHVRSVYCVLFLAMIAVIGMSVGHLWANPHLAFLPAQLPLFLIGVGCYPLYENASKREFSQSSSEMMIIAALFSASMITRWHTVAITLWTLVFACIIAPRNDKLFRPLNMLRALLLRRELQYLGRISYPVYLVHWPLIICLLAGLLHFFPSIAPRYAVVILAITGIPLTLAVSSALHFFWEKPAMAFGKRMNSTPRGSV